MENADAKLEDPEAPVRDVYAEMGVVDAQVTGGDEESGWQTQTFIYPPSPTSDDFHHQYSASTETVVSISKRHLPSLHDFCVCEQSLMLL